VKENHSMTSPDSSTPASPSAPKPATLIHRGEHDDNVLKLQQQLHRLGYPIETDGAFGPATEAALRDAQRHAGVDPNGIAGPQTTLALGNLEAHGYHGDPHWAASHHAPSHHDDHGHHSAAPDINLGTLPFPDAPSADPYKPAEDHSAHDAHDPYAADPSHDDPYKPAEDHSLHAEVEVSHYAEHSTGEEHHDLHSAPHDDPYASPDAPTDDHY